jgi:hypothetical protein
MAMRSQRFGVRNTTGARSSEWAVLWKPNASDVYLATRTLGGSMKASLHASGRCHVRAPDPLKWRGTGEPPRFLDTWQIDVASTYQFPFSVVIPEQELRSGDWAMHRDKGTVWLEAIEGQGVEVGIFLLRADGDLSPGLTSAGWHTTIVDALLPDGRRLLVAAGSAMVPAEKLAELETARAKAQAILARSGATVGNPRMLLLAGPNEHGTRKFVEAAVQRAA